jgi:hypothetical protein
LGSYKLHISRTMLFFVGGMILFFVQCLLFFRRLVLFLVQYLLNATSSSGQERDVVKGLRYPAVD